jgi:diamine N-acetyltransferase
MEAMQQFATGQHDLYRDRQLRWMLDALLSEGEWNTVGAVDLYDFDPRQRRAGVAIHVDQEHRRRGHALGGLLLLARYAQQHLDLVQLYAEVPATHLASQRLFNRAGFVATATRNMWVRKPDGTWDDVVTMQLVFDNDAEPPRPSL